MNEEKRLILNMLKEGKISEDQAIKLLEAIGMKHSEEERAKDSVEEKITNRITQALDRLLNIDLENINIGDYLRYGAQRNSSRKEKSYHMPLLENEDFSLSITNEYGNIDINTWDESLVECRAKIRFDEMIIEEDFPFISMSKENGVIFIKTDEDKSYGYISNLEIMVPKKRLKSIIIKAKQGSIVIRDIVADSVRLHTLNGKILGAGLQADDIRVDGQNSKIEMLDIYGKKMEIETVNGSIVSSGLCLNTLTTGTTNGNIHVHDVTGVVEEINAATINGSIRINLIDYIKPVKVEASTSNRYASRVQLSDRFTSVHRGSKTMTASTEHYKEEKRHLLIKAESINGAIDIE